MFALCTSVTRRRPRARASSNAKRTMRSRAEARDDRDRLGRALRRIDEVLDARVLALRVLAHDDQVDAVVAVGKPGERPRRAHVGVEIELLPERDVDAAVAAADRRRQRPLEADAVLADRLQRRLRQRRAVLRDRARAGRRLFPLDRGPGRLDGAHGAGHHLGSNPVSSDQRHPRRHRDAILRRR